MPLLGHYVGTMFVQPPAGFFLRQAFFGSLESFEDIFRLGPGGFHKKRGNMDRRSVRAPNVLQRL